MEKNLALLKEFRPRQGVRLRQFCKRRMPSGHMFLTLLSQFDGEQTMISCRTLGGFVGFDHDKT
jgi:hypothetical protein